MKYNAVNNTLRDLSHMASVPEEFQNKISKKVCRCINLLINTSF